MYLAPWFHLYIGSLYLSPTAMHKVEQPLVDIHDRAETFEQNSF
jgi:hypothetical protein